MRFVLKALFFLAVVAAFIPRDPPSSPSEDDAAVVRAATPAPAPAPTADDGNQEGICDQRPALCQAAQESAVAARILGGMAMERARIAIADSELLNEFAAPAPAPEDSGQPLETGGQEG